MPSRVDPITLAIILSNIRIADPRMGDIKAQGAALRTDWSRKIGKVTRDCEWILRLYRSYTPVA